jgi:hypothetical protein
VGAASMYRTRYIAFRRCERHEHGGAVGGAATRTDADISSLSSSQCRLCAAFVDRSFPGARGAAAGPSGIGAAPNAVDWLWPRSFQRAPHFQRSFVARGVADA